MSSNFYFTEVICPDAKSVLTLTALVLSDLLWTAATDPLHVSTASGAWLHFNSFLAQLESSSSSLRACEWRRLAEHHRLARILTQAADAQSDTGSPHPAGTGPRPAIWRPESRCQSLITLALLPV